MRTVEPHRRLQLIDTREQRATLRFEVRADAGSDTLTLTGYASTFEPYEIYGGPAQGGWIEQIDPHAFDRTLREKPDLNLLVNHTGMPLARTKSGTLQLSVDGHGLRVTAKLDRSDPDVQRLEPKMRRGDMDEMSFAFRVKEQKWGTATGYDDPMSHRLITEISLQKGDVSVVNFGANPTTVAELAGRRKKDENGMRKTLTLAEAQSIAIVGEKRMPKATKAARKTRSVVEAELAAANRDLDAYITASDAIVARAKEILAGHGYTRPASRSNVEEVFATTRSTPGVGVNLCPPMGLLINGLAKDELQARREAHLAELDRQREEFANPKPLSYGGIRVSRT